ncbi:MAG: hypothetical protein ACLTW9_30730 [Enterocloster sp.]
MRRPLLITRSRCFSLIEDDEGNERIYAIYYDITKEREEQEQLRARYKGASA